MASVPSLAVRGIIPEANASVGAMFPICGKVDQIRLIKALANASQQEISAK
jgi:hypothetical protein